MDEKGGMVKNKGKQFTHLATTAPKGDENDSIYFTAGL